MKIFLLITFLVFYTEAHYEKMDSAVLFNNFEDISQKYEASSFSEVNVLQNQIGFLDAKQFPNVDVCQLDKDAGSGIGSFPRYYYNKFTQKCEEFIYRGFGGNCNNFLIKQECEAKCCADKCPANEVYKECGTACPKTCCNMNSDISCIAMCVTGCFCKDGYVRNDNGVCIHSKNCPKGDVCQLDKAVGRCLAYMPRYFYNKLTQKCELFIYGGCEGNCNNFLTKEECEAKCCANKCPKNEVYKKCGTACPKTCSNLNIEIACIDKCVEGCFCKDGYVRNDGGVCINPENCPKDDDVCQLDKVVGPCQGKIPRYYYNKFTQKCEKFFYGGCKGNCNNFRTKEECEDKCCADKCPANEVYQECGTACPTTCCNLGIKINCTAICVEGCFCKDGYVRNDNGVCIHSKNCPKGDVCQLDKVVGPCKAHMPRYYYNKFTQKCEKFIYGGCKGNCNNFHTKQECEDRCCTVKCGKNEVYSECVNPCNDCETRGNCQFLVCNKGCDCKKGYYRDSKGVCIPASKCPCKNECPANEVYKECGPACVKTCSNMNIKIACVDKCVEGCFCKDGYVRDDKGVCINPKNCPKDHCPKKNPWVCVRASNECCTDSDCPEDQICCQENCGNCCRDPVSIPTDGQRVCDPGCPLDLPSEWIDE